MLYFKTKEQIAAEAWGGVIGLLLRLVVWCLVYSPFVAAFGYVYYVAQQRFHPAAAVVLGIGAAVLLLLAIGFLYGAQMQAKSTSRLLWFPLFTVNLVLISGLPFLIGAVSGIGIFGLENASILDQVIAGGFSGCILALPAYFGVTKNLVPRERLTTPNEADQS